MALSDGKNPAIIPIRIANIIDTRMSHGGMTEIYSIPISVAYVLISQLMSTDKMPLMVTPITPPINPIKPA